MNGADFGLNVSNNLINRAGSDRAGKSGEGEGGEQDPMKQLLGQNAMQSAQGLTQQANSINAQSGEQVASTNNNIQDMGKQIATNVSNDRPQDEQRSQAAGSTVNSNTQIA